jgi:hypothetical protein
MLVPGRVTPRFDAASHAGRKEETPVNSMSMSGRRVSAGAFALCLLLSLPSYGQSGNPNPGAIPVNQQYEQLAAAWWQWAFSLPVSVNPLFDETGDHAAEGQPFQPGNIFFLAGVFNVSGSVTRDITIPTGTRLFFPILNANWDNVGIDPPFTVEELHQNAAEMIDSVTDLHVTIDGKKLKDLFSYRVIPPAFCYTVPATDNVYQHFGYDVAGQVCPVVTDGYWIFLAPLSPGDHEINFGGTMQVPSPFTLNITYRIQVVPGKK